MKADERKLTLDLKSAAELAGVSIPTMAEFVRRDDFPAFKAGRRWVIPCDLLKQWLERQAGQRRQFPGTGA